MSATEKSVFEALRSFTHYAPAQNSKAIPVGSSTNSATRSVVRSYANNVSSEVVADANRISSDDKSESESVNIDTNIDNYDSPDGEDLSLSTPDEEDLLRAKRLLDGVRVVRTSVVLREGRDSMWQMLQSALF